MYKKNILIIDDSALMRRVISDIIDNDDRFKVLGTAINGREGLAMLKANINKVDVVLLDINMPIMDGLELLEHIKNQNIQTTVIVVSAVTTRDAKETILALELGAFDFVTKPEGVENLRSNKFSSRLLECLSVATKLKTTDMHNETHPVTTNIEKIEKLINRKRQTDTQKVTSKLITIACSTGGPKALHSVIPNIPKNIDAGVIVIQHMPEGFTKSLADRLNSLSEIFVKEADDGDILMKGRVYIAKGGKHLRVVKDKQGNHIIRISDEEPRRGLKPSADIMYESLLDSDYDEITCVVLTGMGSDGRDGILNLSNKKRIYVIAQDRKSSVVYGMPKMIKMTGLVDKEVSLHEVSEAIIKYVGVD